MVAGLAGLVAVVTVALYLAYVWQPVPRVFRPHR